MINFKIPERRQSPRIKFEEHVQVINASLEDSSAYSKLTKAINLSERGMMVLLPKPLQMSSKAIVIFTLPGSSRTRITAEVRVVWVVPNEKDGFFNTGFQFVNLEPLNLTAIRAFLDSQMQMNNGVNNPGDSAPAQ